MPLTLQRRIRSAGLYGKVTAERWISELLPYADGVVNLVVSQKPLDVSKDELLRVLAPNGVAYIKQGKAWTKTVKPWPENVDQWTHYLHDASGNAIGPPARMQWMAAPTWTRNHHTLASISAIVSAGGRIFYIIDSGPLASIELPSKWSLVARDAFNGVLLWAKPIATWAMHRRKFRSGPVQLPRILVAGGDCVYVPLGLDAPLTALDAATGEVVRTYKGAEDTEEIILSDGVLIVVTGSPVPEQAVNDPGLSDEARFPNEKSVVAFRADTGKQLWKWSGGDSEDIMPLTLAASSGRVFFAVGKGLVCLAGEQSEPENGAKGQTSVQCAQGHRMVGGDARGVRWRCALD